MRGPEGSIATPLGRWMVESGTSARTIAEALGLSESVVRDWRIGRTPTPPLMADRIAELFGAPVGSGEWLWTPYDHLVAGVLREER